MHPKALPNRCLQLPSEDNNRRQQRIQAKLWYQLNKWISFLFSRNGAIFTTFTEWFVVSNTSVWCNNGWPSAHLFHHQLGIKVKRANRLPRIEKLYCVSETKDKRFAFRPYQITPIRLCIELQQQVAWAVSQEGFLMPLWARHKIWHLLSLELKPHFHSTRSPQRHLPEKWRTE